MTRTVLTRSPKASVRLRRTALTRSPKSFVRTTRVLVMRLPNASTLVTCCLVTVLAEAAERPARLRARAASVVLANMIGLLWCEVAGLTKDLTAIELCFERPDLACWSGISALFDVYGIVILG